MPDKALAAKAARAKLKPRNKPYYRSLTTKLQIGYRRGEDSRRWYMRELIGVRKYKVTMLGPADDDPKAGPNEVLSYDQAVDKARKEHEQHGGDEYTGPYKVRQACYAYVEFLDGRASQNDTKLRFAAYVLPKFGEMECCKLSKDELVKWHRSLAKTPPRLRTRKGAKVQNHRVIDLDDAEVARKRQVSANRILALLKAALNHALAEGRINCPDRTWRTIRPFKNVNAARKRYLSLGECTRLINAAEPEFRKLVRLALETGARYQELARLKVSDFNTDSGTLHIQRSKSGHSRDVILTKEGQAFVARLCAGRKGHELMLGKSWGDSYQIRPMRNACEIANISPPINFHGLRHTWASHSVMGGMPLMVVAQNLGHADTRMVEKYYGHLAKSFVAEEVRKGAPVYGIESDKKVANLDTKRAGRR